MIKQYTPKEFIQHVLIDDLDDLTENYSYYAFFVLCATVEVLGKCLDKKQNWNKDSKDFQPFKEAIRQLNSFDVYKGKENELYDLMRCGLLHAAMPKPGLQLTRDRNDLDNNKIGCKEFKEDIIQAWNEIQERNLAKKDLSSKSLFFVVGPDSGTTPTNVCQSSNV